MFDPEKVPAYLRTVVPALWGSLIAWLLAHATWIPDVITTWLQSDGVIIAVTALVIGLWYAFWRWLEPKLPAWLTRILLGSNKAPSYNSEA